MAKSSFEVEIVYADPKQQILRTVHVSPSSTLQEAIEQSGILTELLPFDLTTLKIGVFSKLRELNSTVQPHDRIELYRPLIVDPKENRRLRAGMNKKRKSS